MDSFAKGCSLIVVNINTGALSARAGITSARMEVETAMQRLSSGKRINSAKDDAAGVAISSRLDSTVRGLNQSIRNALDAQALIDTAEGGMQETETILQRIRELSIQASNDTNFADDRANLNAEAQSLLSEIDRISSSTTWAGQSLLDGTFTGKSFQVGTGTMAADQLVTSIAGASSGYLGLSGSSGSTITTPQKIGSEFQVNTYTTGDQGNFGSSITVLSDGKFVIAWESEGQDGSSYGVYGQVYNSDRTKFGAEFQVNTSTNDSQIMPVLTHLENGGFMAAWRDKTHDGDSFGTFAQVFNQHGNKVGGQFQVNTTTARNQFNPSISTLTNGSVVVTWMDSAADGNEYGMFGQIFSATGNKIGSEFQINTYASNQQHSGKVTGLEDGGFAVTWTSVEQDGDSGGIYLQLFDENATKVVSETQVNSTTTGSQDWSDIASLADGGFIVTWQSDGQDGDSNGIFGQRYGSSGAKAGSEFQVNTQAAGSQENGTVIGLSDGSFLMAWSSSSNHPDGSGYGIYGQRYDSGGNTVGDEFQINTYESGDQSLISLEQLSDGEIIASWTSDGQDGDGDGVFAQIFDVRATNVDLTNASNSQSTITLVDAALQTLNSQRARLGALSNRIDHIVASNTNISINIQASLSRIQDADFALETSKLAKSQILQQASTAMLSQANASKQNILTLLQN